MHEKKTVAFLMFWLVFCIGVNLLGCADPEPGPLDSGVPAASCRTHSDCRTGLYCLDRQCTSTSNPQASCARDSECVNVIPADGGGVVLAYPDGGDPDPYCNRALGRCAACRVVELRSGELAQQGCEFGYQCVDGDCVPVADTCTDEAGARNECDPNRAHCMRGSCVECFTDEHCQTLHADSRWSNWCDANFTCRSQEVGYCDESADCDDDNACTRDVCRSESHRCERVAIPGCGVPPADGGTPRDGGVSPPPPAGQSASLTWTRAGSGNLALIIMSAKVDPDPSRVQSMPLVELCRVSNAASITCSQTGLFSGMYLQVSVEYREVSGGTPSWSCLGNGTAGVANGTLAGTVGSSSLTFSAVSNGMPVGCNQQTQVP